MRTPGGQWKGHQDDDIGRGSRPIVVAQHLLGNHAAHRPKSHQNRSQTVGDSMHGLQRQNQDVETENDDRTAI